MDIALLILRLIVGLAFAAHGAQKLFGWFGGYGLAGTGGYFESIGFRPGKLFAGAAGASEVIGGVLLVLGLGGPIAAALIIATMTVAALGVHFANGFFAQNNGFELPLLYAVTAAIFAFVGYGALSLDGALGLTPVWNAGIDTALVALGVIGGLMNLALRRKAVTAAAES